MWSFPKERMSLLSKQMIVSTLITTEKKFRQFFKTMRPQYHTRDLEILESRTLSHIYIINFKNNKYEIIKIYLHHLHLSKEMKNFKVKDLFRQTSRTYYQLNHFIFLLSQKDLGSNYLYDFTCSSLIPISYAIYPIFLKGKVFLTYQIMFKGSQHNNQISQN